MPSVVSAEVTARFGAGDYIIDGEGVLEHGKGDLHYLRARFGVEVDSFTHGGKGFRRNTVEIFFRYAYAQTFDVAVELVRHGLRTSRRSMVALVRALDGVENYRGVLHGSGDRSYLVERRAVCDKSVTAYRAVSGFEPHNSAERRRLTNGAAGIRAERVCGDTRRYRRRSAARTAARYVARVVRIVSGAVTGSFGGGAHREFVHIVFAEYDGVVSAQLFVDRGVVGGSVTFKYPRTAGGFFALRCDIVLYRERYSGERIRFA